MNRIIIIVCTFIVWACNTQKNTEGLAKNKIYKSNNHLVEERYFESGELHIVKHLSLDSSNNGSQFEYEKNGKIKKWSWYENKKKYPKIIINFDKSGDFISFKGTPFLSAGTNDSNIVIQVINPPTVNYIIGYRDIKKGSIIRQQAYKPGIADDKGWVTIYDHKYEKGHEYFLYYYFMKNNKIIDSAYVEMAP